MLFSAKVRNDALPFISILVISGKVVRQSFDVADLILLTLDKVQKKEDQEKGTLMSGLSRGSGCVWRGSVV